VRILHRQTDQFDKVRKFVVCLIRVLLKRRSPDSVVVSVGCCPQREVVVRRHFISGWKRITKYCP